jgi:hypothetical protein
MLDIVVDMGDVSPIDKLMSQWYDLIKGDSKVKPTHQTIVSAKRVGKDCACLILRYGDDKETDTYLMAAVPKQLRPRRLFNAKMRPMVNVPVKTSIDLGFPDAGHHGSCEVNFEVMFNG